MWKFSKHIQTRLKERNITKSEILSIVNQEINIIIIPSDRDKEIDLYFGNINKKYLLVVVNKNNKILVTTRNMREKEIKTFEGEFKHEK